MAAIAARTERIRLSSAVTVLSSDDPVRVFQQFATLVLTSGVRIDLVFGRANDLLFGADRLILLVLGARAAGRRDHPVALGVRLAGLLGLPGAAEFRRPDPLPGSQRVEPDPREVQRFVGVLSDRLAERAEEEER